MVFLELRRDSRVTTGNSPSLPGWEPLELKPAKLDFTCRTSQSLEDADGFSDSLGGNIIFPQT